MEKIYVNRKEVASFDVDPQCGFSGICPDELPVKGALEIVPELNKQALKAGFRLASKDTHNPEGIWIATKENPQFSPVGTKNVDIRWNRHCQVGTKGFEFLPFLPNPLEYDFVAYKGMEADSHPYGACYQDLGDTRSTGVIEFLKVKNVTTVIVAGLALDYCVKTTAIQLKKAGFDVVVNLAGCKSIDFNGSKQAAIDEMAKLNIKFIESSEDIVILPWG